MTRRSKQVHIYLYRKNLNAIYEYAIFQRSENDLCWQGVTGGVEEGETLEKYTDFKWLNYEEADKLVCFHDQKTAPWKLTKIN